MGIGSDEIKPKWKGDKDGELTYKVMLEIDEHGFEEKIKELIRRQKSTIPLNVIADNGEADKESPVESWVLEVYFLDGAEITFETGKEPLTMTSEESVGFQFFKPAKGHATFNLSAIKGYSIFKKD